MLLLKHNLTFLCICLSLCCISRHAAAAGDSHWKAGAAKVAITPSKPVWMAGYAARSGPSDGALVDLFARCLMISDAQGKRLTMITFDLIEIPQSLRDLILQLAKEKHGISPEELLLNVSHTHGGPMVSAKSVVDWGIDPVWADRADSYVQEMLKKVDQMIGDAKSKMADASISYSHARCGFAMNRRQSTPGGFRLGPNPDGPVDHDVPLLRVESLDHKLIGLVFGYACHNTALGPMLKFNGDYAGFAQRRLEQDHPGAVALFLAGCGGDQDPAPRRNLEDAENNGLALALAVEAAIVPTPTHLKPKLTTRLEMCGLEFAALKRAELEQRAQSPDGFVSRHARWVLKQWPKPEDHPADYQLPIHVITLGERLVLIALGGEPVVDYSLRLKRELANDSRIVWVAGYSNLVNAYIPSRRVLIEGGYEGTEAIIYQSLPAPFALGLEERIVKSVSQLVTEP